MASGYPGLFPGGLTTGYVTIGAVQIQGAVTDAGYPGVFPGALTTGNLNIGAVQVDVAAVGGRTTKNTRSHRLGISLGVQRTIPIRQ